MEQMSEKLQEQRKHSKPPKTYPKPADLKQLKEVSRFPAHESTKPGILDLDIHPIHEQFLISGGRDSKAILIDSKQGQILKKLDVFKPLKKIPPQITVSRFVPGQQDLYSIFGGSDG